VTTEGGALTCMHDEEKNGFKEVTMAEQVVEGLWQKGEDQA
jgi:hypothetical protein